LNQKHLTGDRQMGVEYRAERGLLAADEIAPVERSHFPQLETLPREELLDLARWLRARRGRASDIIKDRRRLRRGKAEARGGADGSASERGLAAKKQVFARALRRVNARLAAQAEQAKRERNLARLRAALARKQTSAASHPGSGPGAGEGMQATPNRKRPSIIQGARVGSVSQAGRNAQARRDARG
jgi:hypothetical protein